MTASELLAKNGEELLDLILVPTNLPGTQFYEGVKAALQIRHVRALVAALRPE